MPVSELIDRVIGLLSLIVKKSVKSAAEADLLTAELRKLKGWAYPQLTTEDMVKVTRCKRCQYYKKYKKKGDRKSLPVWACSIDKVKRDPEFYCASAIEKEQRRVEE